MPDRREHRGAHPEDGRLFAPALWPTLRRATEELSWLLSRGYRDRSALKLVGDRHALTERQRAAVLRSACTDEALRRRAATCAPPEALRGETLLIDGFNLLTTIETALGGGVVLAGRDGCFRDIAGVHGSYRKVHETRPAIERVGLVAATLGVSCCRFYLDAPVSNSGRLKAVLLEVSAAQGLCFEVEVVPDPDRVLRADAGLVATADSGILDVCQRWFPLSRQVIRDHVPAAIVVPLGPAGDAARAASLTA